MPTSAGLLMCRARAGRLEVLLAHPGGPYFAKKDEGAWTIPKGLVEPSEDLLAAAIREFREETSLQPELERRAALGTIRQRGGKLLHAWAFVGDCDPAAVRSNTFELEWPPRSGRMQRFPEVDRVAFFELPRARRKIMPAQRDLLDRLCAPEALAALFGAEPPSCD
jgi:predicted NUDIX family NTP pyrophosphohydrolase